MLDLRLYEIQQFSVLLVRLGFDRTSPYALGLHLEPAPLQLGL